MNEVKSHHIGFDLSKQDSCVLKGVALIFLLIHHLFYIQTGKFDDMHIYGNIYLVNMIGQICKMCVPIFIFLSGYGLTEAYFKDSNFNLKHFYNRRFYKLYLNYWLIWILFVPMGIYFFNRSFEDVYGTNVLLKFILDFCGVLNLTGHYGYNPTWWFYSCITILYLLFPLIIWCSKRWWTLDILLLLSLSLILCPFIILQPIRFYLITFVLGYLSCNKLKYSILPPPILEGRHNSEKIYDCAMNINKRLNGDMSVIGLCAIIALFIILAAIRYRFKYALVYDTILVITLIVIYKNLRIHSYLINLFKLLGKHSFNIFLFHTFLYYLYFAEFIFWSRNPIIIFLTLLSSSLIVSFVIEYLKRIIGFNFLTTRLIKL